SPESTPSSSRRSSATAGRCVASPSGASTSVAPRLWRATLRPAPCQAGGTRVAVARPCWSRTNRRVERSSLGPSPAGYWAAMSQENVEVMSRMYEAWLRGDPALFDALDPEIELHPDPEAHWVGVNRTYRGHEGMREYMGAVYEAFEDYRPEVEKFIDVEDKVVTLAAERGGGTGSKDEVQSNRT